MGKAQSSFQALPLSHPALGGSKASSSKSLLERWQSFLPILNVPRCLTRTVHVLELTTISPAAARLTETYKADRGFMDSADPFNQRVWHPPGQKQENSLWRRVCTDTGIVCAGAHVWAVRAHTSVHMASTGPSVPCVQQFVKGGKAFHVHYFPCLLPLVLFLLKVCLSRVWLRSWNLISWLKWAGSGDRPYSVLLILFLT